MSRREAAFATVLLLVGRLIQIGVEPAYLHPDALHQSIEPAFRWVYGYGETAWEFEQGLRGWLWPGLLAIPLALAQSLGLEGMGPEIAALRGMVACIDVVASLAVIQIVYASAGRHAALFLGCLLAVHPAWVVMGAQPLIDVPAAAALAVAAERGLTCPDRPTPSRAASFGAALALALCLRIQIAPAVLILAAAPFLHRGSRRWKPSAVLPCVAGSAFVVAFAGGLDWITTGVPFGATLQYLRFNFQGGQEGFGLMPKSQYWIHAESAMPYAAWAFVGLGLWGTRRQPALGLAVASIFISHQLVDLKVWRFLYPALVLASPLVIFGAVDLLDRVRRRAPSLARPLLALFVVLPSASAVQSWREESTWRTSWLFHHGGMEAVRASRGLNRAYLELSRSAAPTGVVQLVLPHSAAPGHALLGHDVSVVHAFERPSPEIMGSIDTYIIAGESPGGLGFSEIWADPASGVRILKRPRP